MAIKGLGDARRVVNDEWRQLAELPAAGLSGGVPALAGCVRLGEVLGRVRDDPDAVLAAVIGAAQRGDLQAGRIVVQAMLPKLVRMCSRDADNDLQTYLACLWETVVTYPLERRPARVAANLALDTLKRAKRASDGRCETACSWLDAREVPEGGVRQWTPGALAVLRAARQLGLLDALASETLSVVYLDGLTSRQAAEVLGVSADVVRWRCSKAVRRLRAHAQELAAELAA